MTMEKYGVDMLHYRSCHPGKSLCGKHMDSEEKIASSMEDIVPGEAVICPECERIHEELSRKK